MVSPQSYGPWVAAQPAPLRLPAGAQTLLGRCTWATEQKRELNDGDHRYGKWSIYRWFSKLETSIYQGFSMAMLNNQMVGDMVNDRWSNEVVGH